MAEGFKKSALLGAVLFGLAGSGAESKECISRCARAQDEYSRASDEYHLRCAVYKTASEPQCAALFKVSTEKFKKIRRACKKK